METEGKPTQLVDDALAVIAGKWKIAIIWHLIDEDRRFGELRRSIPGVTEKVLTRQLRELETDGIIARTDYGTVPPKVVYCLTPKGRRLLPVLDRLCEWGHIHRDDA